MILELPEEIQTAINSWPLKRMPTKVYFGWDIYEKYLKYFTEYSCFTYYYHRHDGQEFSVGTVTMDLIFEPYVCFLKGVELSYV